MKKALSLTVAALLAVSLTACGGPAETGDEGGGESLAPSAEGWDINPTAYADVKEGGEFVGSYSSEWATFNKNSATGNDLEKVWALSPMQMPWMQVSGDGSKTANPDYLTNV